MFKKKTETANVKMSAKQRLHTAVCMLSLTVVALTTATYAWFTLSASTRVNELELDVSAGANMRIATRNLGTNIDDYFEEVVSKGGETNADIDEWLQDKYSISVDDILLSPQTSGDGVNIYTRAENESSSGDTSRPNLSSGSFMQYELYLIAENDMRVHLSTDEDDDGIYTHIDADASSLGNSEAKKQIVNCVRMSFKSTDKDGAERVVIWEPNKDVGTATTLKGHAKDDDIGTFDMDKPMDYNNDTWVCELIANTPKLVTVRVWVEGEDPACNDDVQRAKFLTWLRFQGTDESNNVIS